MKNSAKTKNAFISIAIASLLLLSIDSAAFESLNEQQLDSIYAGGVIENNDNIVTRIPFHIVNKHATVDGDAVVIPGSSNQTSGSLMIQDGAQSHLNSMININAVNSPVEVLLNLNININSKIGSIEQNNIRPDLRW
ncbi:MAG: hypothetical protein H8E21_08875 [Gammaproteobacteria bacterium]|nr:hypothetical protein [Gammaproteobacteria bacterium]MBL7001004.1 hypothetical protein [Gammaproteobacteria bacterium]